MEKLKHMEYDKSSNTVKVGPGVLWSDLVFYLNRFGMSPQTLQSYSTFSVGGSLSVNAHGITSDHSLQDSVVSLKLIKWDGSEVLCSRDSPDEDARELFGHVIGGYGMFGVIVEVQLKVQPNVDLWKETLNCGIDEFPIIYQNLLKQDDVEIKLARLEIVDGENIKLFVFRRQMEDSGMTTVSDLPLEPRRMSEFTQELYKWFFPTLKRFRKDIGKNIIHSLIF